MTIVPFGTNFNETWIKISRFSYKKMHLQSSTKCQPHCSGQCMKWPVAYSPNSTWFWLELVGNCCEWLKIIMKYINIQFVSDLVMAGSFIHCQAPLYWLQFCSSYYTWNKLQEFLIHFLIWLDGSGSEKNAVNPLVQAASNAKTSMFLASSCSCLCPIHWSQNEDVVG